jgi:predicted flap endonuclease-1-like 5' DNA nuclease
MMQLDLLRATVLASTTQQGDVGGIPMWVILLVALVVVVIGVVWFLNEEKKKTDEQPTAEAAAVAQEVAAPSAEAEAVEPARPDDLTVIEGIGPKISGLLQAAGITTYAQLAAAEVDQLRQILDEGGITGIAHPGTWPQQAKLAAAGEWTELEKYHDSLKGGREV